MVGGRGRRRGDASSARYHRATISPDGQSLAFLRYETMDATTLRLGLWLSSPVGAAPRKFEPPPISGMRYYSGAVQFAPDGKTLGFWMQMWDGHPEFWLVPFPSGVPTQPFLSWRERVPIDQFRWMPDSRHVLFPYRKPQDASSHLWIADIAGGSLQQVTGGTETRPIPRSRRMATASLTPPTRARETWWRFRWTAARCARWRLPRAMRRTRRGLLQARSTSP